MTVELSEEEGRRGKGLFLLAGGRQLIQCTPKEVTKLLQTTGHALVEDFCEQRRAWLTGPCCSDGLTILLVLDITSSKDSPHAGLGSAWSGHDVALLVCQKLPLEELGSGLMTNCKEEPIHLNETDPIGFPVAIEHV